MAIFPIQPEPSRRRGDAGPAWHVGQLRNDPPLDDEVRRADRPAAPEAAAGALPPLHLDEVFCTIGGKRTHLWRAVHDEGEVLDVVVQKRRHHDAALKLLKRLLRSQPVEPEAIVTDGLASYSSALRELGLDGLHRPGRLRENRVENSHLPIRRRERKMQLFKSQSAGQRFPTHASVYNSF